MSDENRNKALGKQSAPSMEGNAGVAHEGTIGEHLKFLGLTLIIAPVSLGMAFLCFNMASYNYARLPNPIAFVMMIITGGFGLIVAIAGPGVLCTAVYQLVRVVVRLAQKKWSA